MVDGLVLRKLPIELYNDLKFKKSTGIMNIYTSIIFNYEKKKYTYIMMLEDLLDHC